MIDFASLSPAELGITDEAYLTKQELRFYDVRTTPAIRIYGLMESVREKKFVRMPEDIADAVSESVAGLNRNTAGGRLRFVTTSDYIALHTKMSPSNIRANLSMIAGEGFDLYVKRTGRDTFAASFVPPYTFEDGWTSPQGMLRPLPGAPGSLREVTINFPLYHDVCELYIGLDSGATLGRREDYTWEKPILFYGSSITQGASATRPGMAYTSLISRRFDANFVNLGFSGACRAEDAMIDYLKTLDCSVFVLDYDHNAPSVAHLAATHEKLYLAFRESHPTTPVIMVTKPDFWLNGSDAMNRRDVIHQTYKNARLRGEKVLFVDGYSLFAGELREECTTDGCHPNDIGMARMADTIGKAVDFALSM